MQINWKYQNNHLQNPNNEWDMIQRIEKDICFLYHQLSSYSYIMGDLDFSEHYSLPYWDYINIQSPMNDYDKFFIQEGCLILILTMAWEQIDGAGCYINDKFDRILNSLKMFEPINEQQSKLHDIVTHAVNYAKKPDNELYNDIGKQSIWVHREYVRGYFRKAVHDFDNNPYFKNE